MHETRYATACVTARQFLADRKAQIGTQHRTTLFKRKTGFYTTVVTTGNVTSGHSGNNIICIRRELLNIAFLITR